MEAPAAAPAFDAGSTAWMLTSSALVLLMVPGLALFYGGMVRRKNVLTTMMMSFVAMAVIGVQWVLIGYALAFGQSKGGFIGWDPALVALSGIDMNRPYSDKGIPELVFVMFQGKFAIITPALISGAVAERMRFRTYLVFTVVWATLIYCPLAHWVWASDGWLFARGVLDFAGGTVVHIAAGVSALVLALMLGPRRDFKRAAILPNNLVLTLTGAGLLWFGWFGFNAGSAVAVEHPAGATAGLAFTTTQSAAAAAGLSWMLMERWHHGKVTSLGLASGFVAGLVVVTPAAGHVRPLWALVMGALASVVCYWAVQLKNRFNYDDSLDAFGVHGVGGIVGALLTGVFCFTPAKGLIDGEVAQLGKQALGVAVAIVFAGGGTFVIASILKATMGLRATEQEERDGQDLHVHGERGYHFDQT
ncbi:MAG: ammonium transporter [Myxococcaceae bacterium]|jgi:Amt family ammonium transporter|nr:ammonium transporter [Myxococcaceae bacterium]